MKIRLVALLALIATGLVFAASPASAQRPIPGIKQTAAYKQLKNYVSVLYSKRNTPASNARKGTYKTNLSNRRKNANTKVQSLYSQKLVRISKQDDNKQRRDIKRIRQNQKSQVQSLNARLAVRLGALQDKQNSAQNRVYASYAIQINPLADKRDRLKRQLSRTVNPAKRTQLTRQINKIQTKLNALVNDRTTDLNNLNNRFALKTQALNNQFGAKIASVKAQAQKQIQQERNAWRTTFRVQIQAAKTTRDAQKDMVSTVAERGFGYIEQMPPLNG